MARSLSPAYNPLPLAEIKRRLPAVLAQKRHVAKQAPAGYDRKHIFDTVFGIRIIAALITDGEEEFVQLTFGYAVANLITQPQDFGRTAQEIARELLPTREQAMHLTQVTETTVDLFFHPK